MGQHLPELNEYEFIIREVNGKETLIAKANRTGEEGFDIYISSDGTDQTLWESFIKEGDQFQLRPFGLDTMETLRIEAGIPIYGVDMNENTIPIEAGLWDALNFEKGCYVGQEVIARIKWRGHVNWHLVGFEIQGDDIPNRDSSISTGEREIGYITSSAFSPGLKKIIALGYIRREFKEPGTMVIIHLDENKKVPAEVIDLPFYKTS